jgi:hypothetical protein
MNTLMMSRVEWRQQILAQCDHRRQPSSGFAWTVIGLDPVSVRIDDEGSVIIRAVFRAQTRRAVVTPAGAQRSRVKCIDRFRVGSPE